MLAKAQPVFAGGNVDNQLSLADCSPQSQSHPVN